MKGDKKKYDRKINKRKKKKKSAKQNVSWSLRENISFKRLKKLRMNKNVWKQPLVKSTSKS